MEKTSAVSARITVKVEENDYKDKVTADLKKLGQTHSIPGFRKGHVPFAELYRRFGRQMTSDVINDKVYEAVTKYIDENKLHVLGEPMPVEVKELDLKNEKDFTFEYDLALAPEINLPLDNGSIKVPYYTIEVTDKMIDEQDEMFRRRFGRQEPGEEFEPDALVKGAIMELDAEGKVRTDEDAIQVIAGIVMPLHFKDKAEAAKFEGAKVDSKVVFNPAKAAGDDLTELASMLNIDKDRAANVTSDFEMAVSEIIVLRKAEPGEELYNNVFGPDRVHNEEEYRAAIKQMIAQQLAGNSEQMFQRDFTDYMIDRFGKDMELPDELLKRWLVRRNEELTDENIDAEYDKMKNSLKWQLIRDALVKAVDLNVTEDDLVAYAKMMARQQFASYGMTNVDDETLADYAKRILADRSYRQSLIERVADAKLFDAVKAHIDVERKEVPLDEFRKLAEGPAAE